LLGGNPDSDPSPVRLLATEAGFGHAELNHANIAPITMGSLGDVARRHLTVPAISLRLPRNHCLELPMLSARTVPLAGMATDLVYLIVLAVLLRLGAAQAVSFANYALVVAVVAVVLMRSSYRHNAATVVAAGPNAMSSRSRAASAGPSLVDWRNAHRR
jgi:hypothetical protein